MLRKSICWGKGTFPLLSLWFATVLILKLYAKCLLWKYMLRGRQKAAPTEQLLKRLSHLKVIIKRDYLNYFLAYIPAQIHTHLQPHTHTSTGKTIQQHAGNLSKWSEFILAAKVPESWNNSWACGDGEKVSMKEKTVQDPGYTAAEDAKARRDPGQMSLSLTHTHIYKNTHTHTHTSTSQLHWWDAHSKALSHDSCHNSLPTSSERKHRE